MCLYNVKSDNKKIKNNLVKTKKQNNFHVPTMKYKSFLPDHLLSKIIYENGFFAKHFLFMYIEIVYLCLGTLVFCQLTCESGETFIKYKKVNKSLASQESFEFWDGSTLLYQRSEMPNNVVVEEEICISASANNQYTLKLIDSRGNSWSSGSYLTIYGKYGNVVFKNYMTEESEESYTLSLYYGIEQNAVWKMTFGSITTGWTAYSFSDSTWADATLGSVTTSVFGTQYFRKQFAGLSNMAAYDVRLYYKAGVIAYINGAEVYRDNMPAGDVTASTAATGQYADVAYRGFIRPGSEVTSQQSILAVEVHFVDAQTSVDFDAFVALLAPSASDSDCFIYSESVEFSDSNGPSSTSDFFDFNKQQKRLFSYELPYTVNYEFEGPKPFVNAFRLWPSTNPNYAPDSFFWEGSYDNSQWTTLRSISGASYVNNNYKIFTSFLSASLYGHYRVTINKSARTSSIYIYEFQPLICHTLITTEIPFPSNSYTFYAKYEEVYIKPSVDEFSSCTAENLPDGLTINSCIISGFVYNTMSDVHVTVNSVVSGQTYSGSFYLSIIECSGTYVNVLRVYEDSPEKEIFEIKDVPNDIPVISVAANTDQIAKNLTYSFCLTENNYMVTVAYSGSERAWSSSSHLYIRAVLNGNEMETILRMRYDPIIGFPSTRYFNPQFPIKPHSDWNYLYTDTPNNNWYSSSVDSNNENWENGNVNSFPYASNQIQLYKKSFSVSNINNIAGFVLSIKYQYGCIVYLNDKEVFRNGIPENGLNTENTPTNTYENAIYRQISLPIKTMIMEDGTGGEYYLIAGDNTIAIGLLGKDANTVDSIFDCALRLMTEENESRIFEYEVSASGIQSYTSILNQYSYGYSYSSSCDNNYFNIAFNNDRREWINCLVVKLY